MDGGRAVEHPTVAADASRLAGRRVTVTGGASFIGSHLTDLLVASGAAVRVADDLSSGSLEHLSACRNDVEVVVGDLRDPAVASNAMRDAEVVFHLAARHGGRGYIDTHPVDCVGNAALDNAVFTAAAAAGAHRVVFASSACVYPVDAEPGDGPSTALREDAAGFGTRGAAFADGEYGWAKLYGELQLSAFARAGAFDGTACRLFNVYGERQNDTHAVIALADRVLTRADPFLVWGDGSQRRAFTYVGDAVSGLAAAGATECTDVVNLGSPVETSITELCDTLFDLEGWSPSRVEHDRSRPVGSHARLPDISRAAELLGWFPSTGLRVGLERTLEDRRARRGRPAVGGTAGRAGERVGGRVDAPVTLG